jgi:hypothetical protein
MATFRMTIHSTWPLADLFTYMATFSNAAEWDPGVIDAEALSVGEPALSSEYLLHIALGKRQFPLTYRIVEFDRLRRVVLHAENKFVRSLDTLEFNPAPGGTKLVYEASLIGVGPLGAAEPIIGVVLRKLGARAEESLRAKLEAAPILAT